MEVVDVVPSGAPSHAAATVGPSRAPTLTRADPADFAASHATSHIFQGPSHDVDTRSLRTGYATNLTCVYLVLYEQTVTYEQVTRGTLLIQKNFHGRLFTPSICSRTQGLTDEGNTCHFTGLVS